MMGSENEEGAHPYPLVSSDEMETLILDDPLSSSKLFANYRSAITTLSNSYNHPLSSSISAEPTDSDPLLFSVQEEDRIRPKEVDFSSHFEDSDYSDVFGSSIKGGVNGGGRTMLGVRELIRVDRNR